MSIDSPLFSQICQILRQHGIQAWLVGGAVRDLLMGRSSVVDFDFTTPEDGLRVGRLVADALQAAFFPLDTGRRTGRVIISRPNAPPLYLDFAALRGDTLLDDLRDRDFSVNAIAMTLSDPPELVDPFNGQADLQAGVLRAVSPRAFQNDPVRVLRAVRQMADTGFRLEPETEHHLRQAVGLLPRTSAERQRDELVKMLNTDSPGQALVWLKQLDILPVFLPEVAATWGVTQGPPHHLDVFHHTVAALTAWANMYGRGLPDLPSPRRQPVLDYLHRSVPGNLQIYQLMPLAVLLHDTGKPATRTEGQKDGRRTIGFVGHEREGAKLAAAVLRRLRFSNQAVETVKQVVAHHMRPLWLADTGDRLSRRAIYRFFRDTDAGSIQAGVLTALHALVDHQATYPPDSSEGQHRYERLVVVVDQLLQAYFEQRNQVVQPPPLLSGRELMAELNLPPGPAIGALLRRLQEAQATGEVQTREDALNFIKSNPDVLQDVP